MNFNIFILVNHYIIVVISFNISEGYRGYSSTTITTNIYMW